MNAASSRPLTPEYHPDFIVRGSMQEIFKKTREIKRSSFAPSS